MNLKQLLLFFFLAGYFLPAQSQQCVYDQIDSFNAVNNGQYKSKKLMKTNYVNWFRTQPIGYDEGISPSSLQPGCRNSLYLVPVVFHVMEDSSDANTQVADSIIEKQLQTLNDAYKNAMGATRFEAVDMQVQFVLAKKRPNGTSFNGINHINYSTPDYRRDLVNDYQRQSLAGYAYYDPSEYVNIWVVKDIRDASNNPTNVGGYSNIGYGSNPVVGIVIRYQRLGRTSWCNACGFDTASRAKTLVHEMGHYLGLLHTFENGCSAGDDSVDCAWAGDLCCDARPVNHDFNCSGTNNCSNTWYDTQSL